MGAISVQLHFLLTFNLRHFPSIFSLLCSSSLSQICSAFPSSDPRNPKFRRIITESYHSHHNLGNSVGLWLFRLVSDMDSRDEGSKSILDEEKEEKGIVTLEKMTSLDSHRKSVNGEGSELNFAIEGEDRSINESAEPTGSPVAPKVNGDANGEKQKAELFPISAGSSSNSNLDANSAPSKGYGLKKWRRIRRDVNKDGGVGVDSSVILKRRLSLNETPKSRDDNKVKDDAAGEFETPTPSVGSLRSVEAVDEAIPLDLELVQLVAGAGFSIGVDSDNSEDRSSKSSTAASFPKPRHEIGFGRERGRTKSVGGRGSGSGLQQRSQRGRGSGIDTSKKIRGDRVRIEKENSQSSVESDLRSSNAAFVRWGSGASNGKQSEKSSNLDLEHGDEVHTNEEVRSGYYKENGVVEDLLGEDMDPDLVEEEIKIRRKNFHPPSGIDPFVESIVMLQAAREALETEIQKIGEIGKATELDDMGDLDDQYDEEEVSSLPSLQGDLLESNKKIVYLENQLEEATATIKAKELKMIELEEIIKRIRLSKKNFFSAESSLLPVDMLDLESEVEDLLKKKIQAEVELFIITSTAQSWKILAKDQSNLLDEQKSLAGNQEKMTAKLRDAEDKAIKLKEQAEKLELCCKELSGTEEVLKLQKKVRKFSVCSTIQLLLLCVAFALFLDQLMPPSYEIVPT